MSATVCLGADCLYYPQGGHIWVYLNWALGLRKLGYQVIWLEQVEEGAPAHDTEDRFKVLRCVLEPYGLGDSIALCSHGSTVPTAEPSVDIEVAVGSDVLLNLYPKMHSATVGRFHRTALIDTDPGLLQMWVSQGHIRLAPHTVYFSMGETVGQSGAPFPDLGLKWLYTPPCVALDWWPMHEAGPDAAFTTVSHWYGDEDWIEHEGRLFRNDKRSGFLPFLELPRCSGQALELALCFDTDEEREELEGCGWRVKHSYQVSHTPWDYQRYVQCSLGEFSCAKPSCVIWQNAWISDRTLCYLASGKPAVVQHTGESRFLPHDAGLFRFRDLHEAVSYLELVATDYQRQCDLARGLAEAYFDAGVVVSRVLEFAGA
ncbi:MAG TPA: hypothetical protein VFB34_05875 [Chloroflexota bacterium]|nr:hypothetical protein [Chloroflexota bacterium]